MTEEVNSKAPAASSTANYAEFHRKTAMSPGLRVQLSRYRAEWGSPRRARLFGQNLRKMRSRLRLAQHDKRKSEDDGRSDHGSELGKYRPQSARSELECLAPCSPTKIVHVGLHVATSSWARRPATADARGKGG
jgi:hypothetical protein